PFRTSWTSRDGDRHKAGRAFFGDMASLPDCGVPALRDESVIDGIQRREVVKLRKTLDGNGKGGILPHRDDLLAQREVEKKRQRTALRQGNGFFHGICGYFPVSLLLFDSAVLRAAVG